MTEPLAEMTVAFGATTVRVFPALHEGEPAIGFEFGIDGFTAPPFVLHRSGFPGLPEKISEAMLDALAFDGHGSA